MTRRHGLVVSLVVALSLSLAGLPAAQEMAAQSLPSDSGSPRLQSDLDRIFDDPVLARAMTGVRVVSLATGRVLYERDADKLVIPASNMKIVTIAVAGARLGWDFRYDTRLEFTGAIAGGTLTGDLVVTGSGDPSIGSRDGGHAPLFLEWADALRRSGVERVSGRIVGDDTAFDRDVLGAGWAWDNLVAGYAAPVGALNYHENVAVARITPGSAPGRPALIGLTPPGHGLDVDNEVTTGTPDSLADISVARLPGSSRLTVRGNLPAGGPPLSRTVAIDSPTRVFVEALRLALSDRGIPVSGGAWGIDQAHPQPVAAPRTRVAVRRSEPLSALASYAMKTSQNFYAEAFLKTLGRSPQVPGSAAGGRLAVRETLQAWGIPPDSVVMYDGSGLSRYNYVTAATMVDVLAHVWRQETMRGPFVALLPVAGRDGTLEGRMRNSILDRNVQAKTGTINNVRALSGYVQTAGSDKLAFAVIVNHHTAPTAEVDAVVERALARLAQESASRNAAP